MKKLLILMFVIVGIAFQSQAQRGILMPLIAGDTLVESSSVDTVFKTIPITAGYSALGIQVVTTKVSGTVAGKAYLYSSIDGTNYTLTDSSAAFSNQTTNTAFFTKTGGVPYVYYRVQVREVGLATGTQSNIVRVWYVARKHD